MSHATHPETSPQARSVALILLAIASAVAVFPSGGDAVPLFTRIQDDAASTDAVRLFGGGWADRNGDGYLDLYTSGEGNQFYESDGAGGFVAVTGEDFVIRTAPDHWYPMGIWADWNDDGHLDLYRATFGRLDASTLAYLGPAPDILYRNAGPPTYELIRETVGDDTTSTSSMAWVDYDRDGDLDLSTTSAQGTPDLFYRNDGAGGFASLVDLPFLGVGTTNSNVHAWIDIDDDGDDDLYTVNHREPNELWKSLLVETGDPDSFAQDMASLLVQDGNEFDIAADWSDFDNDGDFDVFIAVTNGPADRLFRNEGAGSFVELLSQPGGVLGNSSFGTWGDLDNDGDEDLFVGRIAFQQAAPLIYRNDGDGVFVLPFGEYGQLMGSLPSPQAGEWGDYDLDGDLDLYVITFARPNNASGAPQPNYLYRNEGGTGNHWLLVECEGTQSNRSAIGARVRVLATISGQPTWQSRIVWGSMSGNSSQSDLRVHFGLGEATTVDSLRVEWPSGLAQSLTAVAVDQVLSVLEPGALAAPETSVSAATLDVAVAPNPFNPSTALRFELPAAADVRLDVFDASGRLVRRLADGLLSAGAHTVSWDGRDRTGRAVATGVYLVKLDGPAVRATRKLVLGR